MHQRRGRRASHAEGRAHFLVGLGRVELRQGIAPHRRRSDLGPGKNGHRKHETRDRLSQPEPRLVEDAVGVARAHSPSTRSRIGLKSAITTDPSSSRDWSVRASASAGWRARSRQVEWCRPSDAAGGRPRIASRRGCTATSCEICPAWDRMSRSFRRRNPSSLAIQSRMRIAMWRMAWPSAKTRYCSTRLLSAASSGSLR